MKIIFCYICILFIFQVNSKLPDEKRKELFDLYAKKLSLDNADDLYLEADPTGIRYDKSKIEELIKKYNFPSSYNFIEDKGAPVHIKNQGKCGCCWAMSSTTVMAYRFFLKGYTLDLSPQHELSCYMKNCNGNNLIDPFLSLTINGTLTEECLPFTSGARIIEECPSKCKDPNIEYKKYYAKNAYTVKIDKDNIYNVTAIIMDQLVTNGPVMTSIEAYADLYELAYKSNCSDIVYAYDGKSSFQGGHAITIVGYGYLDDKYYWLIQNSWGEKACGDGFMKIEFGQVGIGSVSFAEPLIEKEESREIVKVSYGNRDDFCDLEIKSESNLDNWKNQLIIVYEDSVHLTEFKYYCSITKPFSKGEKKISCNYENFRATGSYKGLFKYKTFRSTGNINNFIFDESFHNTQFYFYGNDKIHPICLLYFGLTNLNYYISENSRRISFLYEPIGIEESLPNIYANEINDKKALSNCVRTNITKEGYYIAYCDITDEEMEYFDKCGTTGGHRVISQGLCGINYYRNIIVCRMDEKSYPIFRVHSFELIERNTFGISATLNSSIEGNIDNFEGDFNTFLVIISIENGTDTYTDIMSCSTGNPTSLETNYNIGCTVFIEEDQKFDNVYAYPYYGILFLKSPFEVIIKEKMKGISHLNPEPNPTSEPENNSYSKFLNINIICVILLFCIFI